MGSTGTKGRYMVKGSLARTVRRAGALALVASLLLTTPAFAVPESSASTPTASPDAPATTTQKSNSATKSTTKDSITTKSTTKKSTTEKSTTTRKPPSTTSEIDVQADAETEAFRKKLAAKQKEVDELKAQLDALDTELEIAYEHYNAARDRLSEMKQRVATVQGNLDKTQQAYDLQSDILGERASAMYRDGSLASIEILLDSKSVSDFMSRVKFLNTIGVRDADIAASLEEQKNLLEKQVENIKNTEAVAESIEFELKARHIEILLRIQEREDLITEAQADVVALLEEEAQRRSAEDAALFAEVLSGASKKGIVVQAGGPVETALAYHGVPYLWGGESPSGFDCSGLMLYVFRQHGVNLPRYSGHQFRVGEKITISQLAPGDAVFFGSPIHHVGMYVGGGYYLHAPRTGDFVKISKLADRSDYAGARRYAWSYRVGEPKNAVKSTSAALNSVAR